MRALISFLPRLWANWITLFGSVIATLAGLAILIYFIVDMLSPGRNPYHSAALLVMLPALFVVGLLLIPIGLRIDRRRPHGPLEAAFTELLQDRTARNRILFVAAVTVVNVALLGFAGKESVEYMDSPKFCGTSCHSVMQPEWNAYQKSPHANVACVQCHIGAGTGSYVKAKLNGLQQVWALVTNTHHRPVHPPEGALGETCVSCHSQKLVGNKLKIYPHYKADEKNTPAFNAFMLRVGGPRNGKYEGIHSHANPDLQIKFEYLDQRKNKIGKISVFEKNKLVSEYLPPAAGQPLGEHTMGCVDCHNRPTHIFDASPEAAVDRALYAGTLDKSIPNLRKTAVSLLAAGGIPRQGAAARFEAAGVDDKTAQALAEIYRFNVYPELKLSWGAYSNHLSHNDGGESFGCFRCHDKEHAKKLPDGSAKALSQDCDSCHERVVMGEDPSTFDDTLQLLLPK